MKLQIHAVAILAALAAPQLALARTEPNSFLNRPARTHAALMNQVRNDPEVMDRFKRHFAMTRNQVLRYFEGLRLTRLTRDQRFPVYGVPDSGELRSRDRLLRRGTPVWVDATGKPVLKEVCGNPLTRGPSEPDASNILFAELIVVPAEDLDQLLPPLPGQETYLVHAPVEPDGFIVEEVTVVTVTEPVPPPVDPDDPPIPHFIPIPVWDPFDDRGNGDAERSEDDIIVIPEPASLTALAAGLAALGLRRRKRAREDRSK
jgi:hypothetical protein